MKKFAIITGVITSMAVLLLLFSLVQKRTEGVRLSGTEIPTPFEIDDFQLKDIHGQPFTREQLLGKLTVVYFGFTRCPDACPTTMAYFRGEIPRIKADVQDKVQFVMVSIDPETDTLEKLGQYVKAFSPKIQGATGTEAELQKFVKSMKTSFHKDEKTMGEPDLYMMAHSPKYFLINTKAQFMAIYDPSIGPGVLAQDLNYLAMRGDGTKRLL